MAIKKWIEKKADAPFIVALEMFFGLIAIVALLIGFVIILMLF
jgi:hypothetical protein